MSVSALDSDSHLRASAVPIRFTLGKRDIRTLHNKGLYLSYPASGLQDPAISNMPKLEGVIKGIKSTQARAQSSKHTRLPITPHIIKAMGAVWEAQGPSQDHVMLWAAVTLCFFGFLRSHSHLIPHLTRPLTSPLTTSMLIISPNPPC